MKLQHLDELEDYPRLYGRREEEIIMDENQKVVYCIKLFFSFRQVFPQNKEVGALIYFLRRHKPSMLEGEFHSDYRSDGPHGKKYLTE